LGFIIPTPVIRRFLKDISDGHYDCYADLGVAQFPLFNPAMRRALGMPDNDTGVVVTNVVPGGSCDGLLKDGDILDAIDGHPVDSAGMVVLDGETMNMDEIVERKFTGDNVTLHVRHDNQWKDVTIPLKRLPWMSMYAFQYDKLPRYVVFAGFVFQPLDTNLYSSSKLSDIHVRRLYADYVSKGIFKKRPDVVILTHVESDPITSQLEGFAGLAVDKINGTEVRDLKHANELLHPAKPPEFHVIEFVGSDRPLVIPSAEVEAANQRVAKNYHIPRLANLEDDAPATPSQP